MAPLGKNKRNESIKDTPDGCVPQQCLQAAPCLKHTKQKAAEKVLADPISLVGMSRLIITFLNNT